MLASDKLRVSNFLTYLPVHRIAQKGATPTLGTSVQIKINVMTYDLIVYDKRKVQVND